MERKLNNRKINLKVLLLILIFSNSLVFAQKSDPIEKEHSGDNSFVTINLLSVLNPLNPRYRVGYIKSLNPNWRLGLDFGYGSSKLLFSGYKLYDSWGKMGESYQLWEIRPELYYILNPTRKTQAYFSTELYYIHHKDSFQNNFIATKNSGFFLYESANYRRQKYGLHLKTGVYINAGKRFGLNLYTGLGFRFRENTYSDIQNPVVWDDHRDMLVIDYHEYEGLDFGLNWSFGLKIFRELP